MNNAAVTFTYGDLEAEKVDQLEGIAMRIQTVEALATLEVGKNLSQAKEILLYDRTHGGWRGWIESKTHFSRRTADDFVAIYEKFGAES